MRPVNNKISVVVPVYNATNSIVRCVDSILSQTYSNIELILVDDGSTDGSSYICDEYSIIDSRVKVIHLSNGGPAIARNEGIKFSSGDWLTFVDADDYIELDAYRKMIDSSADFDMIISGKFLEYEKNKIEEKPQDKSIYSQSPVSIFMQCESANTRDYIWNRFYKMDIVIKNKIFFEDIKTAEDTIFNIEYHKYCKSVKIISYSYYHYVQGSQSLSKGYKKELRLIHELLNSKYRELGALDIVENDSYKYFCLCNVVLQFNAEVSNIFYTKNNIPFRDKMKYIDSCFYSNQTFRSVMKSCNISRRLNHSINRFLFNYAPIIVFSIYNYIISVIKK